MRVATSITLLESPSVLAPAAIGIAHPTIILPTSTLDDDELESILAHEVAHVSRRDNLLGLIESLFAAALWFHPLVWIARRVLATTREAACDDAAVAAANRETYLSALAKICSAAVAPRGAGISCIGGNTLKRRMEAIMRNPLRSTLPHRAVTAASVAVIAAFTFGSGIVRATPQTDTASEHRYKLDVSMTRDSRQATFHAVVTDTTTNQVLAQPDVTTPIGVKASVRVDGDPTIFVTMLPNADGTAECEMTVSRNGETIARMGSIIVPKDEPNHGDGITLELKDADIRDVLATFEKLANVKIDVDAAVNGRITINLKNVEWQTGLRLAVEKAGYKLSKESETHFTVR